MGDFEVLAEELEGEAKEGLVLDSEIRCGVLFRICSNILTRSKCVSGSNLLVVWSAMLQKWFGWLIQDHEGETGEREVESGIST